MAPGLIDELLEKLEHLFKREDHLMAAIDDLQAAAARIETAVTNLLAALKAAAPDLGPVTSGLNASAQAAEDALATPAPVSASATSTAAQSMPDLGEVTTST